MVVWVVVAPRTSPPGPPVAPSAAPLSTTVPSPPAPPPVDVRALGQWTPPAYRPLTLRGLPSRGDRFEAAMGAYARKDYAGAAERLRGLVAVDGAQDPAVLFFLGISELMAGRTEEGMARLRQTAALGDTPYLEEARFYLARTLLARGEAAAAARQLQMVVRLRGDLEEEAGALLQRLRELDPEGGDSPRSK
jgi:tetratricopeptide (TPR) repeat protein